MTVKEELLALIDKLPDDLTTSEALYQLYFTVKLRRRAELLESEKLIPRSEVERRFRWKTRP